MSGLGLSWGSRVRTLPLHPPLGPVRVDARWDAARNVPVLGEHVKRAGESARYESRTPSALTSSGATRSMNHGCGFSGCGEKKSHFSPPVFSPRPSCSTMTRSAVHRLGPRAERALVSKVAQWPRPTAALSVPAQVLAEAGLHVRPGTMASGLPRGACLARFSLLSGGSPSDLSMAEL